jgi:hypothetical protein
VFGPFSVNQGGGAKLASGSRPVTHAEEVSIRNRLVDLTLEELAFGRAGGFDKDLLRVLGPLYGRPGV